MNRDLGQGLSRQRHLYPSLSLLMPAMVSLRPLISLLAKPYFSLHWLLPGHMVKSLPSSNQQTNKPSLDLMPYLSSVFSAKLLSVVRTISASSPRRHCPPEPSPLLPRHAAGLHFPASFAVRCGHVHEFWPGDASGREPATFSPAPQNLQCMLPALLRGWLAAEEHGTFGRLVLKMVDPPDRGARVSESFWTQGSSYSGTPTFLF